MTISAADAAVFVTLGLFIIRVTYQAGRISARLESLESFRAEMKSQLDAIHSSLRRVLAVFHVEDP